MRYVRITFYAALFVLGIVFIQQNIQVFSQGVRLHLNLYYFRFETMDIPIYILFLFSFLVGVMIASAYGLLERIRTHRTLREERKKNEALKKELESLKRSSEERESSPVAAGSEAVDAPQVLELEVEDSDRNR